jgi:dTDP-4-amino-4,6-dideoxygalactose transaminase
MDFQHLIETMSKKAPKHTRQSPFAPWPCFQQEEIDAVVSVIKSGKVNYWTGEQGRKFEKEFGEFCGCNHAVAVANGTVALELALHALGIGAGDEVITSSRTFIASASAIARCGATPVVADVDPLSQNLTAETIQEALSPRTRAIIVVHLAGWPCDMDPILELAREYTLKVIEDCAQAQGATYKGRPVGSMGDAAAFSFCQDKIMTTGGEGGMLTTNNEEVWRRAWGFKDHGKSIEALTPNERPWVFRWLHDSFGTNWRMTEMQAAIGRVTLRKIPQWLEIRRRNARVLTQAFKIIPALLVPEPPEEIGHSFYKFYSFLMTERLKNSWNRDRVIEAINAEGVPCFSGICSEIYLEKAFRKEGLSPEKRLPVAKMLGERSLMFLVHPTLSENDLNRTCQVVTKVLDVAAC